MGSEDDASFCQKAGGQTKVLLGGTLSRFLANGLEGVEW